MRKNKANGNGNAHANANFDWYLLVFFPDHFSVWVYFSVPLSKKEFPTGNSLLQTPWGRPIKTLVIVIVVIVVPLPKQKFVLSWKF